MNDLSQVSANWRKLKEELASSSTEGSSRRKSANGGSWRKRPITDTKQSCLQHNGNKKRRLLDILPPDTVAGATANGHQPTLHSDASVIARETVREGRNGYSNGTEGRTLNGHGVSTNGEVINMSESGVGKEDEEEEDFEGLEDSSLFDGNGALSDGDIQERQTGRTDILPSGGTHTAQAVVKKYVAMDCEMVGVGPQHIRNDRASSQLARVSLVSFNGETLFDGYVQPKLAVTDYRTEVSGIRAHQLLHRSGARPFEEIRARVSELLEGRVLVGHALRNDLRALLLTHPGYHIRDTSRWPTYRQIAGGRAPALRRLAGEVLGWQIQTGEHNSVEDARAAMELYKRVRAPWEALLAGRRKRKSEERERKERNKLPKELPLKKRKKKKRAGKRP